ncbi:trap [Radish leaf curl virus-Hajipur [IN:LabIso:11]]|nr:TrAP [Radish leaf curl virus-Hajipur [IN:Bih:ok09]]ADZ45283.1 transactivator protein [Radish leaf curl virus-Hajipur [IN:Bih06:10]]AFI56231.1 trap [Radish leaf curl virus-Hajipur [IN:LabIso:11]]
MQNSSPSPSRCTQVPIKVQHRIAKKRPVRIRSSLRLLLLFWTCLRITWIHAQGNSSLQLRQRVACIFGRSKIPSISRYPNTTRDHFYPTTTYSPYKSSSTTTCGKRWGYTSVFYESGLVCLDLTASDWSFLPGL